MLEYVAHAKHDDGVPYYEDSFSTVRARYHLGRAAKAKNDIAPAFTTGWSMVKLAQHASELRLIRVLLSDADRRESIEDAELLFAESLVDDQ